MLVWRVRIKIIVLLITSIFGGVVLKGLICPNPMICFAYYLRFTRCCPQPHTYLIGIPANVSRSPSTEGVRWSIWVPFGSFRVQFAASAPDTLIFSYRSSISSNVNAEKNNDSDLLSSYTTTINLSKPTGHVMQHQFNIQQLYALPHTVFMCFVFIWEQTATCATYSINWSVFITEMKNVYCAVRTGSLNKAVCAWALKGLMCILL